MATFLFYTAARTQMTIHSPRVGRASSASGFTLIELLIVVALICVLATIAFPILIRARITAHEGTAVASLRTIHSAQAAYASTCGAGGYAQSLDDLAKLPPGNQVAFISAPYTTDGMVQSGYTASIIPAAGASVMLPKANTCNNSAEDAMTSYVAERHPVTVGETGVRSFAVDTQGTMYFRNDGVAIGGALAGTTILP
jgi:type IV pilus assembly protein PilA